MVDGGGGGGGGGVYGRCRKRCKFLAPINQTRGDHLGLLLLPPQIMELRSPSYTCIDRPSGPPTCTSHP